MGEISDVTHDEAIAFLECACRNWGHVPRLSDDDVADVATELSRFASRRAEARQAPIPAGTVTEAWSYTINYGPDGEENYANVYTPDGEVVGNLKIHHARAIVGGLNEAAFAARPALDEAEQKRYFDAGWEKAKLLLRPEDLEASRPAEPVAVKVKPLEWRHIPDAFPPMWVTKTTIGSYHIEEAGGSDSPSYDVLNPMAGRIANVDGLLEAKVAAQADYEARIRSALVSSPAPGLVEVLPPSSKADLKECVVLLKEALRLAEYGHAERIASEMAEILEGKS